VREFTALNSYGKTIRVLGKEKIENLALTRSSNNTVGNNAKIFAIDSDVFVSKRRTSFYPVFV